jgi:hypothetical protein
MGRKATIVNADSIELATILLAQGLPKFAIKKELKRRTGGTARSFETVLSRAREALAQAAGKTRKEMRVEAKQRYEGIISDPNTSTREKIRAQDSLCKLYGLHINRMIHTGTGEGGAIKTENATTVEIDLKNAPTKDLIAARAALQRLRTTPSSTNGSTNGNDKHNGRGGRIK